MNDRPMRNLLWRSDTPIYVIFLACALVPLFMAGCSLLGLGDDDEGSSGTDSVVTGDTGPTSDPVAPPNDLVPTPPPPPPPPPPVATMGDGGLAPGQLPPGVDPSQIPAGYDPSKLPPGVDPSQIPAGYDPSQLPPGVDPSQIPAGYDPSKLPPGVDPTKIPPGMTPEQIAQAAQAGGAPGAMPALPPGVSPDALTKLQEARVQSSKLGKQIQRLNWVIDSGRTKNPADVVRLNRYYMAKRELDQQIRSAEQQLQEAGIPVPPPPTEANE